MKARVKATGEIIDVSRLVDKYIMTNHPHSITFDADELDFEFEPDYWEKLKHQYAGMAMQGMLANNELLEYLSDRNKDVVLSKIIVDNAYIAADELINKLKEESKCKK